jgi:hypothetical protein
MVATAFINSGKRWQSGANESSNRRCCDECLGIQWFKNRIDAKILIEAFRRQFKEKPAGHCGPAQSQRLASLGGIACVGLP